MNIVINQISEQDIPEFAKLVQQVITEMEKYYIPQAIQEELAKYTEDHIKTKLEDTAHYVLIAAFDGSKIVGFDILSIDSGMLHIDWYGVHQEYRNRNIPRLMHIWTEDYCRTNGYRKIFCDTRTNNIESNISLLKNGFTMIGLFRKFWYGQDFYTWEKEIN
jgi:GNAT superfamily N-acetyltransferase